MKKKFLTVLMSVVIVSALNPIYSSANMQIKDAYTRVINEYLNYNYSSFYSLYDIDKDGIDELLIDDGEGGCDVYTYKNNRTIFCDGFWHHSSVHACNEGMLVLNCEVPTIMNGKGSSKEIISLYKLNYDELVYTTVNTSTKYINEYSDYDRLSQNTINYLNNYTEIDFFDIYDLSGLNNAFSNITVKINGRTISFDQPPIMQNDRVMVPMRAIFEALGYDVFWYPYGNGNAYAFNGSDYIDVFIGEHYIDYELNGRESTYYCDVVPAIVNDRTLVPVRAIAECAGCDVKWDGDTQTVIIN